MLFCVLYFPRQRFLQVLDILLSAAMIIISNSRVQVHIITRLVILIILEIIGSTKNIITAIMYAQDVVCPMAAMARIGLSSIRLIMMINAINVAMWKVYRMPIAMNLVVQRLLSKKIMPIII